MPETEISFAYNENLQVTVESRSCGSHAIKIKDDTHNLVLWFGEEEFAALKQAVNQQQGED